MKQLRISNDLSLPLTAVTETIGIVAKRRMGKSFTARKLAEQLFGAGQQVVIVDPKGDHWGVRSAADGKAPGLPIVILGGEHGDVPLEVTAGELVAKLVVEERVSALLDLSSFRKHEVATFMTAFLENLYRLKAREQYRTPLMLIIDEADAIAPQRPMKGEERMLGAAEDIVRRGGQRGIGCTLVTQRTAVLNKNVLTQVQMLVVLRTIAPQDLDAMNAWIDVHGTDEQRRELMSSLPSLTRGDAWFWSPGWPTADGIFQRVHVAPIDTFDSGATPAPGEKRVSPKHLADVDLDALKSQMAATIERAKEADPKEWKRERLTLRARIADLEKQLAKPPATKTETKTVTKFVLKEGFLARIEKFAEKGKKIAGDISAAVAVLDAAIAQTKDRPAIIGLTSLRVAAPRAITPRAAPIPMGVSIASSGITGPQQTIINTAALLEQLGISADRVTLAAWLGLHANGKGFANNLGALRAAGLMEGVSLTDAGRVIAQAIDIPSQDDVRDRILSPLTQPQRQIVEELLRHDRGLTRDELAERMGVHPNGKGFANNLGALRTRQIITRGSPIQAGRVLFMRG